MAWATSAVWCSASTTWKPWGWMRSGSRPCTRHHRSDFGYDISDYRAIDPQFGTLADFDRLILEAAKRGIRVLLDMVLNHTSEQHPWFVEAARSRNSPHHDFYVWSDGRTDADGRRLPPNNWVSLFGGSAWEYVPAVDQFYYHKYYRQQPDLNWRNPEVERAMFGAMRFWLRRGVAGFRLDAITALFEDEQLRDEPVLGGTNEHGDPNLRHIYTDNLPETHRVIRRLRAMIDTYPGRRVLVGETYLPSTADLDAWYGGARHNELHLPMDTLVGLGSTLDAATFRQRLMEAATEIHDSQPLLVFDNHDRPRSWDRYGDGVHDEQIARIIATLLLTSRAAVLLYQGEEIGQRTQPAEARRGRARSHGHQRLATRQGTRWRAHADAVGRRSAGGLQHQPPPVAAGRGGL